MSAEGFLNQVASHLGHEALTHQAGEMIGRARLGTDASSGVEVGVVEGYSAVRGLARPCAWNLATPRTGNGPSTRGGTRARLTSPG